MENHCFNIYLCYICNKEYSQEEKLNDHEFQHLFETVKGMCEYMDLRWNQPDQKPHIISEKCLQKYIEMSNSISKMTTSIYNDTVTRVVYENNEENHFDPVWNIDDYNPLPNFNLPRPISPLPESSVFGISNNKTNEPNTRCHLCNKTFPKPNNLKQHLVRQSCLVVSGDFKCNLCSKAYHYKKGLDRHVKNCHLKMCTKL